MQEAIFHTFLGLIRKQEGFKCHLVQLFPTISFYSWSFA